MTATASAAEKNKIANKERKKESGIKNG